MARKKRTALGEVYVAQGAMQFDLVKARRFAERYISERKRPSKSWLPFGPHNGALADQVILGTIYDETGYKKICLDGHGSVACALGQDVSVPVVTLSLIDTIRCLTGPQGGTLAQRMQRAVERGTKACAGCVEGSDGLSAAGGTTGMRMWDF